MSRSERIWNLFANRYDEGERSIEPVHIMTMKHTKKYLGQDDVVLDLGCGTGTKAFEIAGDLKKVLGVDTSSKMVDVAESKMVGLGPSNVVFLNTDIFDERLEKGSFDLVLAFNVIHYLEDPTEIMRRINELLKPAGLFISSTECLGEEAKKGASRMISILMLRTMMVAHLVFVRFYRSSELDGLISRGNFQIVEAKRFDLRGRKFFFIAAKKKDEPTVSA